MNMTIQKLVVLRSADDRGGERMRSEAEEDRLTLLFSAAAAALP